MRYGIYYKPNVNSSEILFPTRFMYLADALQMASYMIAGGMSRTRVRDTELNDEDGDWKLVAEFFG